MCRIHHTTPASKRNEQARKQQKQNNNKVKAYRVSENDKTYRHDSRTY